MDGEIKLEPAPQRQPGPDVEVALNEPEGELEVSTPQPAGPHKNRWGVLRHKHYRNVWFGQFGSSIGGWMESIGVGWIINTTSPDPAVMLGFLGIAQLGPMMFLGIPGGILADRVNRKMLLLVTQFAMMLIAAGLAIASFVSHSKPNLGVMIGLVLANGIAMAFNAPAWQVLTPRLVPREELTDAIFLNGLQFNLARAIGPAVAGVLYYFFGPTVLFVINTASFVGVLIAVSSTPNTPTPKNPNKGILHQFWEAQRLRPPRARPACRPHRHRRLRPARRAPHAPHADVRHPRLHPHQALPRGPRPHRRPERRKVRLLRPSPRHDGPRSCRRRRPGPPHPQVVPQAPPHPSLCPLRRDLHHPLRFHHQLLGRRRRPLFLRHLLALELQLRLRRHADPRPGRHARRVMAIVNVAVFGSMGLGPFLTGKLGSELNTSSGHIDAGQGIQIGVAATGVALVIASIIMLIWRTPEVDGIMPGQPNYDRRPSLLHGFTASAHRPKA